jgi:hypothetical protein
MSRRLSTMRFCSGLFIRPALIALSLIGAAFLTSDTSAQKANPANRPQGVAAMHQEVRLRKLHLVRPDLIPYPIEYEYYC